MMPNRARNLGLYLAKGAYKLHYRTEFQGLPVSIENRKGSKRYWRNSGEEGSTFMKYPYGYIRGTLGVDGDEVDVFVGPEKDSTKVFVITTMAPPEFREVDEQKCMLGWSSAVEAKKVFLNHYNDKRFFGSMKEMQLEEFKEKLKKYKGKLLKAQLCRENFSATISARGTASETYMQNDDTVALLKACSKMAKDAKASVEEAFEDKEDLKKKESDDDSSEEATEKSGFEKALSASIAAHLGRRQRAGTLPASISLGSYQDHTMCKGCGYIHKAQGTCPRCAASLGTTVFEPKG